MIFYELFGYITNIQIFLYVKQLSKCNKYIREGFSNIFEQVDDVHIMKIRLILLFDVKIEEPHNKL